MKIFASYVEVVRTYLCHMYIYSKCLYVGGAYRILEILMWHQCHETQINDGFHTNLTCEVDHLSEYHEKILSYLKEHCSPPHLTYECEYESYFLLWDRHLHIYI